jgi:hypothetical protein
MATAKLTRMTFPPDSQRAIISQPPPVGKLAAAAAGILPDNLSRFAPFL